MKKAVRILKNEGLASLIKRIYNKIVKKRNKKYQNFDELKKILKKEYTKVIIFENNFGWNQIMKQRPQQIASNFDEDVLFIYGTPYDEFKTKIRIDKIKNNLYLIDLNLYRKQLIKLLKNTKEKFLMTYSTDFVEQYIINKYKDNEFKLIYEYVDNIDKDLCKPEFYDLLLQRREEMVNNVNCYTISTATQLFENVKQLNNSTKVKLITNGVDYEHFNSKKTKKIKEMEKIKQKSKYIIGYYGALASWFDYDLIKKISSNQDYSIVLLGVDFDKTLESSGILKAKNVYYLGKKNYNDLVNYAAYFDICIIPFIINDVTKSTSPVKLFEYMALGKPIVTTNMPECHKYKSVFVSESHSEFIENLKKAVSMINDEEYLALLDKEAKNNSWKEKCKDIIDFIDENEIFVSISKQKRVLNFIKKAYRYLKWHIYQKNKIKIKTHIRKIFDAKTKLIYKKEVKNLLKNSENCDKIVMWISHYFGWNVGLFQRPQHIAMNMARNNIFYLYDASNEYDNVQTIKKVENNLYLINTSNKIFFDILLKEMKKLNKIKYLHIYSTEMVLSLKQMKKIIKNKFNILYEYIDDLSPAIAGTETLPKNILDKYNYCLKDTKNTAVVVTADNIQKDVLKFREMDKMTYSCNGVCYEHFQVSKDVKKINSKMKKIVESGKPIIGYYGALASWFDYESIKYLAENRKDYNIVLIGVKYDKHYDTHKLEKYKNIHYLGTINYNDLPNYAVYFDVCTIPFIINEITEATSPLKLFEYMALHKPIVTSQMHECKKYKSVLIANNKEELVSQIDKALKLDKKADKEYFEILEKEAKENTWENKTKIILEYLNEFEQNL